MSEIHLGDSGTCCKFGLNRCFSIEVYMHRYLQTPCTHFSPSSQSCLLCQSHLFLQNIGQHTAYISKELNSDDQPKYLPKEIALTKIDHYIHQQMVEAAYQNSAAHQSPRHCNQSSACMYPKAVYCWTITIMIPSEPHKKHCLVQSAEMETRINLNW